MKNLILIEQLMPTSANLVESIDDKKNYYLSGVLMQAEVQNGNGRVYPLQEISNAVQMCAEKIKTGASIMGELNHPDNLSIDLKNVSHVITEMYMDGNNAVGRCKLLNTPSGQIAKELLNGGVRLGVSSRGTGDVNNGIVENFSFVTIDLVANPSAPEAYPNLVREAVENKKVMTLAEAVVHDESAQKYLTAEIKKFLDSILKR
jgi:hypothetical protein